MKNLSFDAPRRTTCAAALGLVMLIMAMAGQATPDAAAQVAEDYAVVAGFSASSVLPNEPVTLTVSLEARDQLDVGSDIFLIDDFPDGVTITPGSVSTTCNGGTSNGDTRWTLTALVSPGGSCTVTLEFRSNVSGRIRTTIQAEGSATVTDASMRVRAVSTLAFGASTQPSDVNAHEEAVLSYRLENPSPVTATGISFAETLPDGLTIVPGSPTTTCDGTLYRFRQFVEFTGGTLAALESCVVRLTIVPRGEGTYAGDGGTLASSLGDSAGAQWALTAGPPEPDHQPPRVLLEFGADTIAISETTTLTLTIDNTLGVADVYELTALVQDVGFPRVSVNRRPISNTCSTQTFLAAPQSAFDLQLTEATIEAGDTCQVVLSARGARFGEDSFTASIVSSSQGSGDTNDASIFVEGSVPSVTASYASEQVALFESADLSITVDNRHGVIDVDGLVVSAATPPLPQRALQLDEIISSECGGRRFGNGMVDGIVRAGEQCTVVFRMTAVLPGSHTTTVQARSRLGLSEATAGITVIGELCAGQPPTLYAEPGVPLAGTSGADVIWGSPGDDIIRGAGGDDVICANGGDDFVDGGAGRDVVYGGDGNDRIKGGSGPDSLLGEGGADRIWGQVGDDDIRGGTGSDRLFGQAGDDLIFDQQGRDYINGGDGDDNLVAVTGDSRIDGGAGDDLIGGGFGRDTIDAGPGDDFVNSGPGNDTVDGGPGNDQLDAGDGRDIVRGGSGNDIINGGRGLDTIDGGSGNDEIDGGMAKDTLNGNGGGDTIKGGGGDDTIDGGTGPDICDGQAGTDSAINCETELGIP